MCFGSINVGFDSKYNTCEVCILSNSIPHLIQLVAISECRITTLSMLCHLKIMALTINGDDFVGLSLVGAKGFSKANELK